jgi:RNA polymerase-associated protein CTR9
METGVTVSPPTNGEGNHATNTAAVVEDEDDPSLIIPIRSNGKMDTDGETNFIEIFPEEISETKSSDLLKVMTDEDADLSVWADAALHYIKHKKHAQDAAQILEAGCERADMGGKNDRVRIFAAAGIAHLTVSQEVGEKEKDLREDLITKADNRFTQSSKVDNFYPMTLMGRGMRDLSANRLEQARFFFDTTLKTCGNVLPALLGLAAVNYLEKNYVGAQGMYAKAIRLYPSKSGAATRVGFGLACYRLGQVRHWSLSPGKKVPSAKLSIFCISLFLFSLSFLRDPKGRSRQGRI